MLTSEFGRDLLFIICALGSMVACGGAARICVCGSRAASISRTSKLLHGAIVAFAMYEYICAWAFAVECDHADPGWWNGAKCHLRPFDYDIIDHLLPAFVASVLYLTFALPLTDEILFGVDAGKTEAAQANVLQKKMTSLEEKVDVLLKTQRLKTTIRNEPRAL